MSDDEWQPAVLVDGHNQIAPEAWLTTFWKVRPVNGEDIPDVVAKYRLFGCFAERFFELHPAIRPGARVFACEHEVVSD
jgi:hypothetical protein